MKKTTAKKRIHESEADDEGLRGWQDFFAGETPSSTASDWYLDGYEDAEKAHRDNPEKYSIAMRESLSIQKITKRQLRRIIKEEKQKLLREGQAQEETLFDALEQYVMVLDEEMGYDVPREQLKAAVLNLVNSYFQQTEEPPGGWDQ